MNLWPSFCLFSLVALAVPPLSAAPNRAEAGKTVLKEIEPGRYLQYLAGSARENPEVLVIAHGMVSPDSTPEATARRYVDTWRDFAENHRLLLLAPVFDEENYGNQCPQNWGYRALFGRRQGADEFVHAMLEGAGHSGPFHLFGHSAGGQFASRYLVTHPDRLKSAIISSPKWVPYPNPAELWPNGMGERRRSVRWPGESTDQNIEVKPDPRGWMKASQLPTLVIVGEQDTEPYNGTDHVKQATDWVNAMQALPAWEGGTKRIELQIVHGIGHNSGELARAAMPFLQKQLK